MVLRRGSNSRCLSGGPWRDNDHVRIRRLSVVRSGVEVLDLLHRGRTLSLLAGEEPFLDVLSVICDPGRDCHWVSHQLPRDRAPEILWARTLH